MKKAVSIFQTISTIIGVTAVILVVVPLIFGIKTYIVLSGSMEPNIQTGALAYVNTKYEISDIKEGDVIAFRAGDSQVTHRVVSINDDRTFTTKGDANDANDFDPVKFEEYNGKTIFSIPFLGKIVMKAKTRVGMGVIFAYVLLNVLAMVYQSYCNKKEEAHA